MSGNGSFFAEKMHKDEEQKGRRQDKENCFPEEMLMKATLVAARGGHVATARAIGRALSDGAWRLLCMRARKWKGGGGSSGSLSTGAGDKAEKEGGDGNDGGWLGPDVEPQVWDLVFRPRGSDEATAQELLQLRRTASGRELHHFKQMLIFQDKMKRVEKRQNKQKHLHGLPPTPSTAAVVAGKQADEEVAALELAEEIVTPTIISPLGIARKSSKKSVINPQSGNSGSYNMNVQAVIRAKAQAKQVQQLARSKSKCMSKAEARAAMEDSTAGGNSGVGAYAEPKNLVGKPPSLLKCSYNNSNVKNDPVALRGSQSQPQATSHKPQTKVLDKGKPQIRVDSGNALLQKALRTPVGKQTKGPQRK